MRTFICQTPCWHEGHKFKKGQSFVGNEQNLPQDKDGKLRHFVEIDASTPAPAIAKSPLSPEVIVNGQSSVEPKIVDDVKKKLQDLP